MWAVCRSTLTVVGFFNRMVSMVWPKWRHAVTQSCQFNLAHSLWTGFCFISCSESTRITISLSIGNNVLCKCCWCSFIVCIYLFKNFNSDSDRTQNTRYTFIHVRYTHTRHTYTELPIVFECLGIGCEICITFKSLQFHRERGII